MVDHANGGIRIGGRLSRGTGPLLCSVCRYSLGSLSDNARETFYGSSQFSPAVHSTLINCQEIPTPIRKPQSQANMFAKPFARVSACTYMRIYIYTRGFVRIHTYVVPHTMYALASMYKIHHPTNVHLSSTPKETRQSCSMPEIWIRSKGAETSNFITNACLHLAQTFIFLGAKYRDGGILHAACTRTVDQEKSLPDPNRVHSGRAMY